ncbi:MAG TPA: BatD family protein, partial [Flavitalea sp.]|nr:BatD family protein [Flavitalea sp.]
PEKAQPGNYSGAVGQFSLQVKPEKSKVRSGELIRMHVTISGSGNLPLLTPPAIEWKQGLEGGEPVIKENINKYAFPVTGSKTFTYNIVAEKAGKQILPAVTFSYFDPVRKEYKTLRGDSVPVNVEGIPSAVSTGLPEVTKRVRDDSEKKWLMYGIIALAICTIVGYQFFRRDPEVKAVIETSIPAPRGFDTARELLYKEESLLFFREVEVVLWRSAADACSVSPSSLNQQNLSSYFEAQGIPAVTITTYLELIKECEWAMYGAKDPESTNRTDLLERAEKAVEDVRRSTT